MKWTAPAALLATTLLAGTGKAQDFTYRTSHDWRVVTGSAGHGTGLGGSLIGLTSPGNSPMGGFGILGWSRSGYRLNGTFNNYARYGNGVMGPFGSITSFGHGGGFGSGAILANLMPQIHQHGPLFNYGPYYGYPPFEPYGPWDAYLRYHQPMALVADRAGLCSGLGRGNPHPLCGSLCKRRTSAADGCAAATDVACGGLAAARSHEGWGAASGGSCGAVPHATTDSCGTVAAAQTAATPVLSRYAGCGSPAASGAYYQGTPVPTVAPAAPSATIPMDLPKK
ncbi:MAG TPA: hypothetical protein VMZ71_17730 [Gemmataceae bacterium]|nr:hypothetical protein [Gemmataceae bacterium]